MGRGDRPRFVVAVKAIDAPRRVLRFSERGDFRANYARVVVTRHGKGVKLRQVIADPGPASERDYILLGPGETLTFQHDGEPFDLTELPPGIYSAVVKVQPDWREQSVVSNSVSFVVEQR